MVTRSPKPSMLQSKSKGRQRSHMLQRSTSMDRYLGDETHVTDRLFAIAERGYIEALDHSPISSFQREDTPETRSSNLNKAYIAHEKSVDLPRRQQLVPDLSYYQKQMLKHYQYMGTHHPNLLQRLARHQRYRSLLKAKPSENTAVHEDAMVNDPREPLIVQIFSCTWGSCEHTFPNQLEWISHEHTQHRPLYRWICDAEKCNFSAHHINDFFIHISRECAYQRWGGDNHEGSFHPRLSFCENQRPRDEACKFCGIHFSSWDDLFTHLAEHMLEVSRICDLFAADQREPLELATTIATGSFPSHASPLVDLKEVYLSTVSDAFSSTDRSYSDSVFSINPRRLRHQKSTDSVGTSPTSTSGEDVVSFSHLQKLELIGRAVLQIMLLLQSAFHTHGKDTSGDQCENSCVAGKAAKSSSDDVMPSGGRRSLKRKRVDGASDGFGDDEDNQHFDGKGPIDGQGEVLLFCHFLLAAPERYATHGSPCLKGRNIPRLKEHLYDEHLLYQCERCGLWFDTKEKRTHHYQGECTPNGFTQLKPPNPLDGFGESQKEEIKSRRKVPGGNRGKWEKIWRILYGDGGRIPSPYWHFNPVTAQTTIEEYNSHLVQVATQRLFQALEPVTGIEVAKQKIAPIAEETIAGIIQEGYSHQTPTGATTEPEGDTVGGESTSHGDLDDSTFGAGMEDSLTQLNFGDYVMDDENLDFDEPGVSF